MSDLNYKELKFYPLNVKRDYEKLPKDIVKKLDHQLNIVQSGLMPKDFKPMSTIGKGVYEIRCRNANVQARAIYIAKFENTVYVLHAFIKKDETTNKQDIEIAKARYSQLLNELK